MGAGVLIHGYANRGSPPAGSCLKVAARVFVGAPLDERLSARIVGPNVISAPTAPAAATVFIRVRLANILGGYHVATRAETSLRGAVDHIWPRVAEK